LRLYNFFSNLLPLVANIKVPQLAFNKGLWFHAASVGEVNASLPLIQFFHNRFPDIPILYTVMTKTGQNRARTLLKFKCNTQVIPFPMDHPPSLKQIYKNFDPFALIVIETELWPNLTLLSQRFGVKSYLVNARLSQKTLPRYLLIKRIMSKVVNSFDLIFARYEEDKEKFLMLGAKPEKILTVGSLKYDIQLSSIASSKRLKRSDLGYKDSDFIVVFGSIRSKEEDEIVEAIKKLDLHRHPDIKVIVAPRHLDRAPHFASKLRDAGIKFVFRTQGFNPNGRILILDTIGELVAFYRIADVAFVGGSLANYGGHNILEPASCGVPVIFGPFVWNVRHEAKGLLLCKGGFLVKNADELASLILRLRDDISTLIEAGINAEKFTREKAGVAKKIGQIIAKRVGLRPKIGFRIKPRD